MITDQERRVICTLTLVLSGLLVSVSCVGLNIVMEIKGIEGSYYITIVMAVLGLISAILPVFYTKSMKSILKKI